MPGKRKTKFSIGVDIEQESRDFCKILGSDIEWKPAADDLIGEEEVTYSYGQE